jgi:type I site-specific restriction endonuclease
MPMSEADTRAKLIDPALHARGWTEEHIKREEAAGAVEVVGGKGRRRAKSRTDYTLPVKVNSETQPVAVAVIEAKPDHLPPTHGLEQSKQAESQRNPGEWHQPFRHRPVLSLGEPPFHRITTVPGSAVFLCRWGKLC